MEGFVAAVNVFIESTVMAARLANNFRTDFVPESYGILFLYDLLISFP